MPIYAFKLALTEDEPTIKPYAEDRWAQLADTQATPVEVSLTLLDSLHDRWVRLLRSFKPDDWKRTFHHPERGAGKSGDEFGPVRLARTPSRGPHHFSSGEKRLVEGQASGFGLRASRLRASGFGLRLPDFGRASRCGLQRWLFTYQTPQAPGLPKPGARQPKPAPKSCPASTANSCSLPATLHKLAAQRRADASRDGARHTRDRCPRAPAIS